MPAFPLTASPRRIAALAIAALASLVTAASAAEPIAVTVDRAKVLHISQPADVVIIGNPAIADATIQNSQTLIITGRSFGTTNLIVLDKQGRSIADDLLTVQPADDQVVTVYKRNSRETLSCTPECSPVMALGDTTAVFDKTQAQIQAMRSVADSAAQH